MFKPDDTTYNDIRERSFMQWLSEMEQYDDVAVRGGVKLAREYMEYLKKENMRLQDENNLKNEYLKKVKMKSMATEKIQREPDVVDCGCIYG